MRKLFSHILFCIFVSVYSLSLWAAPNDATAFDVDTTLPQTRSVSQQKELFKARIQQAKQDLARLQERHTKYVMRLTPDRVNKNMLNATTLDIAVAQSNLDSITIELADAEQTVARLSKDIEDIENQLNVTNIFGLKIVHYTVSNAQNLSSELTQQKNVLALEKMHAADLLELKSIANAALQLYKAKYTHISALLKSQTLLQLQAQQAQTEMRFQQQQNQWQEKLNRLQAEMAQVIAAKTWNRAAYERLDREIFYATENSNFNYLNLLLVRYQEQIQQFKLAISRSGSMALFKKMNDQMELLSKQFLRIDALLKRRLDIVTQRKQIITQEHLSPANEEATIKELNELTSQYQAAVTKVSVLTQELEGFHKTLTKTMQQEIAARQGLPGFSGKTWVDLGQEFVLIPTLTYHVFTSLVDNTFDALEAMDFSWKILLLTLEMLWITVFLVLRKWFGKLVLGLPEHEAGHVNLKRVSLQVIYRNLIEVAIVGNIAWLFYLMGVPSQNFYFLIQLGLVWILFKTFAMVARMCLYETLHDREGHDVRLYRYLKWILTVGGVITIVTIFLRELPAVYELYDFFVRLFLIFLLVISVLLLRYWALVPTIITPFLEGRPLYLKTITRSLSFLIPFILVINSLMGLLGFINLVLIMFWYESIFLFLLVGFLTIKGLVHDGMEALSNIFIRYVNNGWLWTEAVLKPFDRFLQCILFLAAWVALFLIYGWEKQLLFWDRVKALWNYPLIEVFNTQITPIILFELLVILSLLYWAARWTREFVYRMLSRTHDLGIRNSIAILSQYAVIVICIFIALRVLGIDFKSLAFVATAFAFGVGLGLRDLVNNFACGFLLLIERPLRVGDVVTINNQEGDVMHIGSRAVTIRTWDHVELIIPNAEIFSKSFINWTAKDNIVRSTATIKIDRHDNPQQIQKLIYDVLATLPKVLTEPVPEVFIKEISDCLIEFEVRYFINLRTVSSRVGMRSEVLMAIYKEFEAQGVKHPHPSHEVYLRNPMQDE